MRKLILIASAALSFGQGGIASAATTITDPTGDFLASFIGDHDADLDVTRFTVNFDPITSTFLLNAKLAGAIDPGKVGLYVIGVDTGTGAIRPFASVGAPNVIFDQAIVIQKNGTGLVTGAAGGPLGAGAITITGDELSAVVPLSFLPTTGRAADHYGFNIWPRIALTNNNQISDFAPNNSLIGVAGVPEPATWLSLLGGFAVAGAAIRRRKAGHGFGVALA